MECPFLIKVSRTHLYYKYKIEINMSHYLRHKLLTLSVITLNSYATNFEIGIFQLICLQYFLIELI